MTIRVIDGKPHVYLERVGLVPVRGASPRAAQALDNLVAFALMTWHDTTTVPGPTTYPTPPTAPPPEGFGFRPRWPRG